MTRNFYTGLFGCIVGQKRVSGTIRKSAETAEQCETCILTKLTGISTPISCIIMIFKDYAKRLKSRENAQKMETLDLFVE